MKRFKKPLCLMLAAMLVFGAAGCSSDGKDKATDPPAKTQEPKQTEKPSDTSAPEEVPEVSTRITDTDVTLRLVRADNPVQPMNANTLVEQEIYARTGVKLEIEAIPGSDFSEKQQTMIATNNMPDIMYDTYNIPDFAPSGVFAAVSDYLDVMPNFSALLDENPDLKKLYLDGKLYYIPVMGRYVNRFGRSPMIRQDILDETGLAAPKTFEELRTVLQAMKDLYPDTYPMANRNGTGNLFTCLAYAFGSGNGVYFDPKVNGGSYVYGQAHEEFLDVLEFLAELYAAELLDPDYAVASSGQWQEKLASGRSSFFFDNPTFAVNFNLALQETDSDAKFAPMEIPTAPNGTQRGLFYMKHDLGATTISAKSANVEVAMKLMDYLYSEEGCDLTNFGLEGVQYDFTGGEYVLRPEVLSEFSAQTDPYRAFQGSIGAGKLGIARYIDERAQDVFLDEQSKSWYTTWSKWSFMGEMAIDPPLTEAENEQVKDMKTRINTILDAEYDKFIMGTSPISDFAAVQQQIIDAGALTIEQIYNDAYARVK